MRRLVVVGASLAGLRAVEAARRTGYTGEITLIGAEPQLPYDRPPLSKRFLTEPDLSPDELGFRGREHFAEHGVRLELGVPAAGLDTGAREVHLADGRRVGYDGLVLTTGARARSIAGARSLRTVGDALAVREALGSASRAVVIGCGFIGSEVASGARARGLDVTVVEADRAPLTRAVGTESGAALGLLHADHGTELRCGVGVEAVAADGVRLADGSGLPADLVVAGIGAVPNTEWLDGSGLTIGDGVHCDATLRAAPGVYAAGDVARWPNPLFDGAPMRLEHWTTAAEQAAAAVRNLLGEDRPYRTVPYFWSDWYGVRIQFVGVPEAEETVTVHGSVAERRWVTLYRGGDAVTGALAVGRPDLVMKYRALIARSAPWAEALDFAEAVAA
ncbi:NAD(P)/FAD-dependent oxidoreductase [Streptomyces sp. NPDC058045]|uniref:NAD(P)/FAD-dependent oxidoreductase n=1 Tax=Streptomyces sp. NPDC058045 TaxID=3346311 RepID=UPI0036EED684